MFFSQDSTTSMLDIIEQNSKGSSRNTPGLKSDDFFGFVQCCKCSKYVDQTRMLPIYGFPAKMCPECRLNPGFN